MSGVFTFHINPTPAPRMTRSDRWKKRPCVLRYFQFRDELRKQARSMNYRLSQPLAITFVIPMPPSWSKKKREKMNGEYHRQKPDLDNLIKAFKDSLLDDDSMIARYNLMQKIWGERPMIIVDQAA